MQKGEQQRVNPVEKLLDMSIRSTDHESKRCDLSLRIEKRLKVPARPVTVEITIDQGERSGIEGKKNSVEDGSENNRGTEMKKGNS